jgi:hypothetical protein
MNNSIDYLIPGKNKIEKNFKKAFWDKIYDDMKEKKYEKLCSLIQELADITLSIIPLSKINMRNEFKNNIDVPFLKQQFENCVFSNDDFIKLVTYWIDWIKKLGMPADDGMMDSLLEEIKKMTGDKGYLYVLPYSFNQLHFQLTKIFHFVQELKKKILANQIINNNKINKD